VRVATIEKAFAEDLGDPRFIPYLQLHEFEALLLADPEKFDWEFPDHEKAIRSLVELVAQFASLELIDDQYDTAPSRRISAVIPEYDGRKASAGPLIAEKIEVDTLRQKCRHFGGWLSRLESLRRS
jgi:hypothetical protein